MKLKCTHNKMQQKQIIRLFVRLVIHLLSIYLFSHSFVHSLSLFYIHYSFIHSLFLSVRYSFTHLYSLSLYSRLVPVLYSLFLLSFLVPSFPSAERGVADWAGGRMGLTADVFTQKRWGIKVDVSKTSATWSHRVTCSVAMRGYSYHLAFAVAVIDYILQCDRLTETEMRATSG